MAAKATAFCICMLPGLVSAAEILVPDDAGTIQEAIDMAVAGDTISVRPGEYLVRRPIDFRGKDVALRSLAGPATTTLRMAAEPEDPEEASLVVFRNGEGPDALLEGFTIMGGRGIGRKGGGIYCYESSPTIRGNTFVRNEAQAAGGGIYCHGPQGQSIVANRFLENRAEGPGGAVCARGFEQGDTQWVEIADNEFVGNRLSPLEGAGGAIYVYSIAALIRGNLIVDNICEEEEAIFCGEDMRSSTLVVIGGNEIVGHDGAGIETRSSGRMYLVIEDNFIAGNSGWHGGGLKLGSYFRGEIRGNVITGNHAFARGGGIYLDQFALATISRNIIYGNEAYRGGGVYLSHTSEVTFRNNTVTRNRGLGSGGGVYFDRREEFILEMARVGDCIIWGNEAPEGADVFFEYDRHPRDTGFPWYDVQFSCIGEGGWGIDLSTAGNISEDPQFVAPEKGDFRLLRSSPCIDAGNPLSPRDPDGTRADMGALFHPTGEMFVRGDADGDLSVDIADAVTVLQYLFAGRPVTCPKAADVDDDGSVILGDAIYLLNYLFAAGSPPEPPYPELGWDPSADHLPCAR